MARRAIEAGLGTIVAQTGRVAPIGSLLDRVAADRDVLAELPSSCAGALATRTADAVRAINTLARTRTDVTTAIERSVGKLEVRP